MTRKFTFLMTAMALILAIMGPRNVAWGQTTTEVSITSFTTTSGNIDRNISYAAYKGNGTTEPAISGETLRIYKPASGQSTGGYVEITAAPGFNLASVTITNSNDKGGTIKTQVDEGSLSDAISLAKSGTHTVSGISASSVKFFNCGGDRLSIAGFTVVYNTTSSTDPSITVTPTSIDLGTVNIGEEASASFTVSQANLTNDITLSAENGNLNTENIVAGASTPTEVSYTITPNAAGEFSDVITISCTDLVNDIEINVSGNAIDPSQVVTYEKVTSDNDLVAGASYILVCPTKDKAAGAMGTNTYFSSEDATLSDNNTVTSQNAIELVLGGTTGAWTFTTSEGLIGTSAAKSLNHTGNGTTTWTISIANDGTATITSTNSSYGSIKYNASSPRFLNYASGQTAVALYKKVNSSSVATPTFNPTAGIYDEPQNVTIECETTGATIYYTLDGSTPDNESTPYSGAINISETTTIKAIAYVGNEASNVATAVYTIIPTYASLAELVAAGTPTATGETVRVTITDEVITDFYTSGNYTNGIFLQVGDQEIEIYCRNVPENWIVGGTVSGTLTCPWKLYGETWELCPENWNDLDYTAPQSQSYQITLNQSTGGTISADKETAAAGETVTLTATPADHYHFVEWTVLDGEAESVTVTNNQFTMPASDVEVEATFQAMPVKQYRYSINGVLGAMHEFVEGESVILEDCEDLNERFTFAGWTTVPTAVNTPMAPGKSMQLLDNMTTFYAVYNKGDIESTPPTPPTPPTTYTATLSSEDIDNSELSVGTYGNVTITNQYGAWNCSAQKQDGKIQIRKADLKNNQPESYIQIPNLDGIITSVVLNGTHNGSGNAFGGTAFLRTEADQNADAIASAESDENGNITLTLNDDYSTAYIMSSAACRITSIDVNYTTATRAATPERYTRVFLNEDASNDIEIIGPSIVPTGSYLKMFSTSGEINSCSYELTNDNANMLLIEDGACLIHSSENVAATVQKNITGYTGTNDNYYLIANPTDNTTVANLVNENGYDLYTFNPAQALEWNNEKGSNTLTSGTGYLYANSTNVTLGFAGILNAATSRAFGLVYAGEGDGYDFPGFNLIGNPFACNAYVDKSFYVIDDSELVLSENNYVAPCEGFFVEATEAGQSVTISTTAPEAPASLLSLTVSQNRGNVIDRAIVSFDGRSNLHKFMMNPNHTNISLAKNSEEFAAISTAAEGEMPVNFKAEKNGTYTITVNTENIDAEYLHLIDNMTGMDTDLLSTPSYTFDAKTSDYASRFKLVFGVKNDNEEMSQANSFAYIRNGEIVISNEGRATLQVIDVLGRIVSSEEINGECRISTEGMTAGVYVLNLNGNVQKIVVR